MRCRRCRTKLSPGKKTCPVCGTLVLKRRGSMKLASSAGGTGMDAVSDALSAIDGRKAILAVFAVIALVCAVCMFAGGCSSCGSCGSCASCTACGSCASCFSCESCGGCTACGSCSGCADDGAANSGLNSSRLNGGKMCTEYFYDSTLYYVTAEGLMSVDSSGNTTLEAAGSAITNVCVNKTDIYYLQYGNVWRTPKEKPLTASDDPAAKYAAERVVNATVSGSDAGVTRIIGFTVDDQMICYWGLAPQGGYNIMSRQLGSYSSTLLYSGEITNVQVYRDCIYFSSREEESYGFLFSVSMLTGETKAITQRAINYYVLSNGCAYVCFYVEGENNVSQISLSSGKTKNRWVIGEIDGMIANDRWIYYYTNSEMTGGDIYRMKPGSGDSTRIFHDTDRIMLNGIAGDYFSVYTKTGWTPEDRLTNASYYIFNAETGERISL